jgi:hypothetical protein
MSGFRGHLLESKTDIKKKYRRSLFEETVFRNSTVNRGGFAKGGVKLFRALTLNTQQLTVNPANYCGFYIIGYPLKAHNSSLDLQ